MRGRGHVRGGSRKGACHYPAFLILQQVRVVDRGGPAGTEDRHKDRQPHDHLGGGDHHHKERDDLPVQVAVHPGEGNKRQVDRVQHEFYAHEDDQGVAADQHAHRADHEQDHGKRHEVCWAHGRASSRSGPDSVRSGAVPSASVPLPGGSCSAGDGLCPSRPPLARAMTGLTESWDGVPSGSSAGKSTALCRAKTPGPGSGVGCSLSTRCRDRSRWVGLGARRSRWASTMAPSAAVISSAAVASNGNTYVVKIRRAMPCTLRVPYRAVAGAAGPIAACPTIRASSTNRAIPATAAPSRCPGMFSCSESLALTPTIMSTNRNSISTAPV